MQNQPLTVDQLNIENYAFKQKLVDGKIQTRVVDKRTGYAPTIKLPWMISPFGPGSYSMNKNNVELPTDWSLDVKAACYQTLDLKSMAYDYQKNSYEIKSFFEFLGQLQSAAVDFAHANSVAFFKKEVKRDVIEEAYIAPCVKKSLKKDNDGNPYPDTCTLKIMKNSKTNGPDLVIEDLEGNSIPMISYEDIRDKFTTLVTKGTPIRAIIQLRTYLVNGKFGFSFKLCAMQLDDKKNRGGPSVFSFKDDVSGSSAPVSSSAEPVSSVPEVSSEQVEVPEDSDEDGEEDSDEDGEEEGDD
jgi:hypothetical protein